MLQELFISNYALIDDLRIDFNTGFSVVTGETGAGKSILLGALGLVTGDRMDKTVMRDPNQKMIIEAVFNIQNYQLQSLFEELDLDYAEDTIIRREVNTSGKSRSFVNDTPVRLNELNSLSSHLLLIHTQHQTSRILQSSEQLGLIDDFIKDDSVLQNYADAYSSWQSKLKALEAFNAKLGSAQQQLDFLQFQMKEIEESGILQEEQTIDELENMLDKIENAQSLLEQSNFVVNALDNDETGVLETLKKVRNHLQDMERSDKDVTSLSERTNSVLIELNDIYAAIEEHASSLDFDSSEAEKYRNKVNHFNAVLQKFHLEDIASAQEHYRQLKIDVEDLDAGDEKQEALKNEVQTAHSKAEKSGKLLSKARKTALEELCQFVNKEIHQLGMPSAQLSYRIDSKEVSKNGIDKIQILFSANKGGNAQPIEKVASGGELSRLMLVIQWYWAMNKKLPTVIFDEIDTGVSGKIAESMAQVMVELGQHMQVITITHSPQVAAKGKSHYWVEKFEDDQKTYSRVKKLQQSERIEVIAQMLSGSTISEEAKNNAKMLLA